MKKEKETSNCVIHDDNHDWGGVEPVIEDSPMPEEIIKDADTLLNELLKKFPEIHIDEPMNWPFRS